MTCGGTTGPMVTTDVRKLFWYQWSLMGSTMGSATDYRDVVRLAGEGKLYGVVDSVFPLDRGREAFERLAEGNQFGKLVIEVAA